MFWPPYSQSGRLARLLDCSRLADGSRLRPIGRLDWPSWPVQSGQSGMTSNLANLARCPIWSIVESRPGRRDGFVSRCKLGGGSRPVSKFSARLQSWARLARLAVPDWLSFVSARLASCSDACPIARLVLHDCCTIAVGWPEKVVRSILDNGANRDTLKG